MYYAKHMCCLIVVLLLLSSCVSFNQPGDRVNYYTLEYAPPNIPGMKTLDYTVRIERFEVAPFYDTNQIIYREGSYKRDGYSYHKWRVNPGDLVTYFLNRDIRYSNLFKTVLSNNNRSPSFSIEGVVDEFLEWDVAEKRNARLSLSVILKTEKDSGMPEKILYQNSYSTTEECKGKSPVALAEAMSLAMSRVSEEIQRDIYEYLSKN
jgi:ABC-type uncharacterized transport system auxiliary subunit